MKKSIIAFLFITSIPVVLKCQPNLVEYNSFIQKADSCIRVNNYKLATEFYKKAFIANGNMGKVKDRYNCAVCFASIKYYDSAFFQLAKIANAGKFSQDQLLENNPIFFPMHKDIRWDEIIQKLKSNRNN